MSANRVTVDGVRALVEGAGKHWAVVISGDGELTQYTTWGRSPEDKVFAGDFAEEIADWVNAGGSQCLSPATGPATVLESFKLDAAKNKAEVERLKDHLSSVSRRLTDMAVDEEGFARTMSTADMRRIAFEIDRAIQGG